MKPVTNNPDDPKALAAAFMLSTLTRAANGAIKPVEAEACFNVMQAYRIWAEADQRDEQLERATQIIDLAAKLNERGKATDKRIAELRALVAETQSSRRPTARAK